jgi:cobalt-zinc-cadmium efflux system membrane fusion protein
LDVAPQTVDAMGIKVVEVKEAAPTQPIKLLGSLYLEGSRLVHVQTVFVGRVIEVGQTTDNDGKTRPLRPGDRVKKDEILAKLWSKEVGEKKSELVDAISRRYLHEAVRKRLEVLGTTVVPAARVQEADRDYQADIISISSLERTLRSWHISEAEIKAIYSEADRIRVGKAAIDRELDRTWAQLDILSPMDGVILEKNFTVGDIIDTTQDMYKIADLSRLGVIANVYEEDLPKLVALPDEERRWTVELQAEPEAPRQGRFESIGNVIDPMQHTAIIKGWLDNPEGQFRIGQFVTATVNLPGRAGLVEVPISSLIDDGSRAFVFIATDPARTSLTLREVKVARRGAMSALLEGTPPPSRGACRAQPIAVGELVVTTGALELHGALHQLQTQRPDLAVEVQP